MATTNYKRVHFYLSDKCLRNLFQTARDSGVSVSKLIRNFAGDSDSIRRYCPDGEHSKVSEQGRKIDKILAKVK